ncbi:MAG: hypothetical protein N2645_22275 [Clostridia bacterium]|nr:hypothetical protein [Clostridia bacterium]
MSFLLDPSIFPWSKEEYISRVKALKEVIETTLRAQKGSFGFFVDFAEEMFNGMR